MVLPCSYCPPACLFHSGYSGKLNFKNTILFPTCQVRVVRLILCTVAFLHLRRILPPPRPQPHMQNGSVLRRTSTARACGSIPRGTSTAGAVPGRASPRRTSTASSRAHWALPDLNQHTTTNTTTSAQSQTRNHKHNHNHSHKDTSTAHNHDHTTTTTTRYKQKLQPRYATSSFFSLQGGRNKFCNPVVVF